MTLRAQLQRSPLFGFFALTFAWSWPCWALSRAIRPQLPWLATLLMFAPGAIAAGGGARAHAHGQCT
jgi:hypothetical protein